MDVRKNLYDLKYQTDLNYLNVSLVIVATLFIAFMFSSIPILKKESVLILKFLSIFIVGVVVLIIVLFFNNRLFENRKKISKLGINLED